MPNNETVKTKSAPKHRLGWVFLALALIVVVAVMLWQSESQQVKARIGNKTYTLTRAVSQAQKERGLSDTAVLAADRGMLFVNDKPDEACFWMKQMHYALDIIWLNQDKKVVHIEQNIAPETYPHTFCAYGQYAIELNAGEVAKNGLKPGAIAAF